jgi:rhodanese-related sulfurtransferase
LTDTAFAQSNITLADFLYKSGNIITEKSFPPLVHSIEIYQNKNQYLLIDIRDSAKYEAGHIEGAYSVPRDGIIEFFHTQINPAGFEKIAIIDDNGPLAIYIATLMRLAGYSNGFVESQICWRN